MFQARLPEAFRDNVEALTAEARTLAIAKQDRIPSPPHTSARIRTLHEGTRLSRDPNERREELGAMLPEAAATPFGDFFEFLVGEAREDLEEAPGAGSRYPV